MSEQMESKIVTEAAFRLHKQRRSMPKWCTRWNGRFYRPVMKAAHLLGFCFPSDVAVEPGLVWCHWCGMRGRR